MRPSWVLFCLTLVAGCDRIFGLEPRADAGVAADASDAAIQPPGVAFERSTVARLAYIASARASHTIGDFTGRLLIVALSTSYSTTTATSLTYGGGALTRVGFLDAGQMDGRIELWSLVDPPAGTADVTIELSNASSSVVAGIVSFTGADPIAPLRAPSMMRGTAGDPTVTVTSATGELVLGVVMWNGDYTTLSPAAGQQPRWNENAPLIVGAGSTAPGAPTVTMAWTVAGAFDDYWVAGAIAIKP